MNRLRMRCDEPAKPSPRNAPTPLSQIRSLAAAGVLALIVRGCGMPASFAADNPAAAGASARECIADLDAGFREEDGNTSSR